MARIVGQFSSGAIILEPSRHYCTKNSRVFSNILGNEALIKKVNLKIFKYVQENV